MIKVCVDLAPELILSMDGHAGADEYGKDIICASCSILAYTLGQKILFMHEEEKLEEEPTVKIDSGRAYISCKPKDNYKKEAIDGFYLTYIGFSLIAEKYPGYVDLQPLTGIPDEEIDKESLT